MTKKIKLFFETHQTELIFLLVCFMILTLFSELPYFNLIIVAPFLLFVLAFLSIFLFQIPSRFLVKTALALLLFCFFLLLAKSEEEATSLGNLIYGLLFIAVIQGLISFFKKEKK